MGARAKFEQMNGNLDSAIKIFEEIKSLNLMWIQYGITHELMFCYAMKMDWDQCFQIVEYIVFEFYGHYPNHIAYFYAALYFIRNGEENREKSIEFCRKIMR